MTKVESRIKFQIGRLSKSGWTKDQIKVWITSNNSLLKESYVDTLLEGVN